MRKSWPPSIAVIGIVSVVEEAIDRQRSIRAIALAIGNLDQERGWRLEAPGAGPVRQDELAFKCTRAEEMRIDEAGRIEAADRPRPRRREEGNQIGIEILPGALQLAGEERIDVGNLGGIGRASGRGVQQERGFRKFRRALQS